MNKLIFSFLFLGILSGCSSSPKIAEPKSYDNTHSYAYNIANQTDLLENLSVLRDFTPEEVEEMKEEILQRKGNASVVLGVAKILTGSLISVIDVAGGLVSNSVLEKHTAQRARWIVMIPKNKFKTEIEAQNYIKEEIEKAATTVLSKYGEVYTKKTKKASHKRIIIDGKEYNVGLATTIKEPINPLISGKSIDFDSKETFDSYTYGTTKDSFLIDKLLINVVTVAMVKHELPNINLNQNLFNIEITKLLPKGFYLYSPPAPRAIVGNVIYRDFSIMTPTIYTQGKKFQFIKPNSK